MAKGNYQLVETRDHLQWLCVDGSIINEPPHYRSAGGRKIKINLDGESWERHHLSDALASTAVEIASRRGTKVWMPLGPRDNPKQEVQSQMVGDHRAKDKAELHYLHGDAKEWRLATRLYWRFKHPTLPIWSSITVLVTGDGGPSITTMYGYYHTRGSASYAAWVNVESWDDLETVRGGHAGQVREMPAPRPDWMDEIHLGRERFPTVRAAVTRLGELVRQLNGIEEIASPDLRPDISHTLYSWLPTVFYDTNVTSDLLDDIQLYVEGEPLVEEMSSVYARLQELMRRIGISLPARNTNDFMRAVAGGDAFRIPVGPLADKAGDDAVHALHVDLVTGAFVVECSVRHEVNEETATAWEVAKFRAEMTGELDELLAYARAWVVKQEQDRVRAVLESSKDSE